VDEAGGTFWEPGATGSAPCTLRLHVGPRELLSVEGHDGHGSNAASHRAADAHGVYSAGSALFARPLWHITVLDEVMVLRLEDKVRRDDDLILRFPMAARHADLRRSRACRKRTPGQIARNHMPSSASGWDSRGD